MISHGLILKSTPYALSLFYINLGYQWPTFNRNQQQSRYPYRPYSPYQQSSSLIGGTGNTGSWRKKPLESEGSEAPSKKK